MAVEPTPLSASNPRISDLRRLSGRRRSRVESGRFVIEGPVPILEVLDADGAITELVVDVDAWRDADPAAPLRRVVERATQRSIPTFGVASTVLASVADTATPQGAVAVAPRAPVSVHDLVAGDGPLLVVVDLADPGNAGTAIRAAEAAGACGVVFAGTSTDPYGPKAVRAAAGSIARLPIADEPDVAVVLDVIERSGRRTVGTVVTGGAAPESLDLAGPVAILVGSEAHGLPDAIRRRCHDLLTIPMASTVESINVAMASSVVLFEAARQRRVR